MHLQENTTAMIEEITFKNVLSFKDEVTLSFEATDDSNLESPHVVTMPNGTRLLKVGIIYGANASGKSNLLYAIDNLREFWFADPQNMDVPTGFEPFLLDTDTPNQPSEYSIKFWVNGIRYWYQLTATNKRVIFEKLSYYKTVQPIRIFDRKLEDGQSVLSFNPSVQKIGQEEQKTLSLNCLPNKSFFAVRGRVNMKMEHVDAIRQWIHSQFMPMLSPSINMTHYCQKKIGENADFKEYLLNFLHLADFNITGLNNHFQEEIIPQQVQSFLLKEDTLPEDLKKKFFSQSGFKKYIIGFEHTVENERGKETYELGMEQQSAGTRRVMGIESTIYEAIDNNAFLMIDEMESSIHPDLMEYILQEYLLKPSESQLLITTHYSGLFNTIDDLIRKDNIWFVEKGKNGSTDLFSLVEFKGLNKVTHFERVYRKGMFGALPNIKN